MSFAKKFEKVFKSILPSPFTIAVILTFLTFVLALLFTENTEKGSHFINLIGYWEKRIWNNNLLVFAFHRPLGGRKSFRNEPEPYGSIMF